eukprot:7211436-Pyramimonas_sp.AAC.2
MLDTTLQPPLSPSKLGSPPRSPLSPTKRSVGASAPIPRGAHHLPQFYFPNGRPASQLPKRELHGLPPRSLIRQLAQQKFSLPLIGTIAATLTHNHRYVPMPAKRKSFCRQISSTDTRSGCLASFATRRP